MIEKTAASSWSRRAVLRAGAWAMLAMGLPRRGGAQAASPDKWVDPPPTQEPATAAGLIDEAEKSLDGGSSTSEILCDARYMPVHAYPRFRESVRKHATAGSVTICDADEPGERSTLRLHVVDSDKRPVADALVYIYHTSAKGWYSDRAYHVRASSGDQKHARLFGYVRTDRGGDAEIRTIRPAGYPDSDLPAHYHVEIYQPDRTRITEVQFLDDPRLTSDAKARSARDRFVIVDPKKDADGHWILTAEIHVG